MQKKLNESQERKRGKRGQQSRPLSLPKSSDESDFNKSLKTLLKDKDETPKKEHVELDYTMDGSVKQLFLNLTRMQIPFNYEKTLAKFFPADMETDTHGNYFKKIGNNGMMFCGHLDTYCREYKRVWHVIDGDLIKTDGTTTLGGDDKAGITIMIKMMEADIPGLYYFFRGEEGVTSPTGTWGSKQALKSRKEYFSDIKKCIAFDRKGLTSIISEQMYTECCSEEFVKALTAEFNKNGLEYKDDPTGMWCDSGVFMEMIPECTNISVGYKAEHTMGEEQNIAHLEKLVEAAIKIDWNSLPVKRDPNQITKGIGRYNYDYDWAWDKYSNKQGRKSNYYPAVTIPSYKKIDYVSMDDMFFSIELELESLGYECVNHGDFEESASMYFDNDTTGDFFGIRIIDFDVYMSEDAELNKYTNYGGLNTFLKYIKSGVHPSDIDGIDGIDDDEYNLDNQFDRLMARYPSSSTKQPPVTDTGLQYTKNQMNVFEDVAENNVNLVKQVMDDFTSQVKKNYDLWRKIDDAIINAGHRVDYTAKGTGINPDDFMEWVGDHWIEMEDLIKVSEKRGNIKNDLESMINKATSGFLPYLKNSEISATKYHYDQFQMFSKLVENERLLVKLMLKNFEITNKATVKDSLMTNIKDELSKLDYKRTDKSPLTTYPQKFIEWVYEYSKEIMDYYKMKK